MADELEGKDGEQNPVEIAQARLSELEGLVAQRDEELASTKTKSGELERTIATKDGELAGVRQSLTELETRLTAANHSLAEAVTSYKTLVIQANPEVVVEMVGGDTIAAIDESLGKAKALVSKVKQGMEAELRQAQIPAGSPERTGIDLSTLSPREKIQYAIGGKK